MIIYFPEKIYIRLNPYRIEQNLAPILNPSFQETIYIENCTNLRICYARERLAFKKYTLAYKLLNQASKNITYIDNI